MFPLSPFECRVLTAMNVSPFPNSWAFFKAFQVFCTYLHIRPSFNTFMYFYQIKHNAEVGWVSLKEAQHGPLFTVYHSSFKKFKNKFFKLKCALQDQ